jgi:hypothetical protein
MLAGNGVHRYLVTATADSKMSLWTTTGMFTNWLEGRPLADGRETWLVTVFDNDSKPFLAAAQKIGVTVEEIQGGGESESYDLLIGRPGSGWQGRPDDSGHRPGIEETPK